MLILGNETWLISVISVILYVLHIPAEISILHNNVHCTFALSRRNHMFNKVGQKELFNARRGKKSLSTNPDLVQPVTST